ncbi:hypothetical protein [Actinomadura sp. 9N407]|uniref:hypothetical protein n=1 Tax=Actinomadura sp. 9N407 TaxID=3375154 RepID=UPI0037888383
MATLPRQESPALILIIAAISINTFSAMGIEAEQIHVIIGDLTSMIAIYLLHSAQSNNG